MNYEVNQRGCIAFIPQPPSCSLGAPAVVEQGQVCCEQLILPVDRQGAAAMERVSADVYRSTLLSAVVSAAVLSTQPALAQPAAGQMLCGMAQSCSAEAAGSSTTTPLAHWAQPALNAGRFTMTSAPKCGSYWPSVQQQQQQHEQQQVGYLDDSSPLSSLSCAVISPAEVVKVGCKRSYGGLEQQLQPQVQQQAVLLQQQQLGQLLRQRQLGQLQAAQQQRQAQRAHLQMQACFQELPATGQLQQVTMQQVQQQQTVQAYLPSQCKAVYDAVNINTAAAPKPNALASYQCQQYMAAAAAQQQQQQQQLLIPQGSGTSTSSSFSVGGSAGSATSGTNSIWQQLVQQQEQKSLLAAAAAAAATLQTQQQQPLLGSASSLTTSSSSSSSGCMLNFLQQQQQQHAQSQQPPAKRAATQAAVAALMSASAATQVRQQQLAAQQLLQQQQRSRPVLAQRNSNNLQTLPTAAAAAAAAAAAGPYRSVADAAHNRLLTWAGQVLSCQLQDAYLLAVHIYKRVAGRLDDMLLISLGVTMPVDSVTMLVSLWVASKLEGHRRQVAGCSKLAAALQLLPWAVTSVELHMMQLMDWQPYAGWALRPQEPSCVVSEY